MKQEQQDKAQRLYFHTDLTKTEIAEALGISRRSLHYWIKDNQWDRLKKSAEHMPCLLAENCYLIMARMQEHMLSELRTMKPPTPQEINAMHKLTLTIRNLKGRSTLNETLEMSAHFMEFLYAQNPVVADLIKPFIDDYIKSRASIQAHQFKPDRLSDQGHLPVDQAGVPLKSARHDAEATQLTEDQLDLQDIMFWTENKETEEENPITENTETAGNLEDIAESTRRGWPVCPPHAHPSAIEYATSPSPSERAGVRPLAQSHATSPAPAEVYPAPSAGWPVCPPHAHPSEIEYATSPSPSERAGVRPLAQSHATSPAPSEVYPAPSAGRPGVRPFLNRAQRRKLARTKTAA